VRAYERPGARESLLAGSIQQPQNVTLTIRAMKFAIILTSGVGQMPDDTTASTAFVLVLMTSA
jgi:putative protein kinase ArgK-like GTPase of G3E family